jgi:hypothetical protein
MYLFWIGLTLLTWFTNQHHLIVPFIITLTAFLLVYLEIKRPNQTQKSWAVIGITLLILGISFFAFDLF